MTTTSGKSKVGDGAVVGVFVLTGLIVSVLVGIGVSVDVGVDVTVTVIVDVGICVDVFVSSTVPASVGAVIFMDSEIRASIAALFPTLLACVHAPVSAASRINMISNCSVSLLFFIV